MQLMRFTAGFRIFSAFLPTPLQREALEPFDLNTVSGHRFHWAIGAL
jgi:hypothetical protein